MSNAKTLEFRYGQQLEELIERGKAMLSAVEHGKHEQFQQGRIVQRLRTIPGFHDGYQTWFSESQAVVEALLPRRLSDFVAHYASRDHKDRWLVSHLLQGNSRSLATSIGHLRQQVAIVEAARSRFDSSLYEIRQLVAADLFDSGLDVARELVSKGYSRAAGIVAGVVLEQHLKEVCQRRGIAVAKNRTIGALTSLLKKRDVLDVPEFRRISYLGDIRNLCAHKGQREPERNEVEELISGVAKTVKTLF